MDKRISLLRRITIILVHCQRQEETAALQKFTDILSEALKLASKQTSKVDWWNSEMMISII